MTKPQAVRLLALLGILLGFAFLVIAAFYVVPAVFPAAPVPTASPSPPAPSDTPVPQPTVTATASATATEKASPTPVSYAARLPIIEYHYSTYRVNDQVMMTTDWFTEQMGWLAANGYHAAGAAELVTFLDGGNVPAQSVVLTFDIGTATRDNFAEVIIPALRANHLHALFFVVTSAMADVCGEDNRVCWDDLRAWSDEGLVDVESHGVNHPDYATIPTEQQRADAGAAKTIIETKIGKPVLGFAFPYDSYTDGATRVLKSLGYQFGVSGNTRDDRAVSLSDPDRFALPRVYPYSNPDLYPVLYGSGGRTFAQILADDSTSQGARPVTSTPGVETPLPSVTPTSEGAAYFAHCQTVDKIANPMDRLLALSQMAFPTDLGAEAQTDLGPPVVVKPSCNVFPGNHPIAIVLHATRGELAPSLSQFQSPGTTSAHYVIDRDGQVYQLVPETLAAFHASCGGTRSNCVPSCPICQSDTQTLVEPYLQSIGIELVNLGQIGDPAAFKGPIYEDYLLSFGYRFWEDYPDAQIRALILLVNDIRARWGIPLDMVMGHYRVNEKTDPGPALNLFWQRYGNPPRAPIFAADEP